MGTQEGLTTEQLEFLTLVYDIEVFGAEHGNETGIKEILTQDQYMEPEDFDKILKVLVEYGYMNEYGEVTIAGKQYIDLFAKYLAEKEKNLDIVVNNRFVLINLEKLNAGLNTFVDLGLGGDVCKGVISAIKRVIQVMKKGKQ